IERNGTELGSRPAFSTGETTYSYSELYAIAGGIRDELLKLGCGHGQRIGLVAGSSVHTTASILAIWSLGAAYVPLNVHYPAERNGRIVASAGLDLVLTSRPEKDWPAYLPKTEGTFRLLHSANLEPASGNLGF